VRPRVLRPQLRRDSLGGGCRATFGEAPTHFVPRDLAPWEPPGSAWTAAPSGGADVRTGSLVLHER
jgi:hypothetical protein